jgi:hypothetical protein
MKYRLVLFTLLLGYTAVFAQNREWKEYSYAEFFERMMAEQDTAFTLSNAVIVPDSNTDSLYEYRLLEYNWDESTYEYNRKDTIHVYKPVYLDNVHFINRSDDFYSGLSHVYFHEKVQLKNMLTARFLECTFEQKLEVLYNKNCGTTNDLREYGNGLQLQFNESVFNDGVEMSAINFDLKLEDLDVQLTFNDSHFYNQSASADHSSFMGRRVVYLGIENCTFHDPGNVSIYADECMVLWLRKNIFEEQVVGLGFTPKKETFAYDITENVFNKIVLSDMQLDPELIVFDWEQLKAGIADGFAYEFFYGTQNSVVDFEAYRQLNRFTDSLVYIYLSDYRIKDKRAYRAELKMLGGFYNHYKSAHDTESANAVFVTMKDLETQHLQYLYAENPSFDTFFTLQINQFLKVFSLYGTRPSRAIIVSLYVIAFFALIYLFFPNSWDKRGKNRIIDRYSFFIKYMNQKAGIHEVYLEERREEIMQYDAFRSLLERSGETVPRFFTFIGLPLYKWAVSANNMTAAVLRRFDIMNGTWKELPAKKRLWKSVWLTGAFLIAVAYDIFIKMLNALMLSINTFTTLGFGEIPIKGLPRYLAIVQGFIGWFMLTIFSVSLISQLLN